MANNSPNKYAAKPVGANGWIHYTEDENQIWAELYQAQSQLVNQHMVNEYIVGLKRLDLPTDRVPQCAEISSRLNQITGWRVEPVPALIGYDRFFYMLANKTFPAASFIRDRADFSYVTEPDIFHEIFGHAPLLTHPQVTQFSQFIGQIGTQIGAENHAWLARLYWFTLEFGLIQQNPRHHASSHNESKDDTVVPMGAAIASSQTEVVYASISEQPQRRSFDVVSAMRTPILFGIKQPIYYVLESFDHLLEITERDISADILVARKKGMQLE